jgi:hypothetical protein
MLTLKSYFKTMQLFSEKKNMLTNFIEKKITNLEDAQKKIM